MTETQLLNETMQHLVDEGEDEARSYIERHFDRCEQPHSARVYDLRFTLAALCGQNDEAMRLLAQAVTAYKLWFKPEVFNGDALRALRGRADFEACRAESDRLYQEARAKAKTLCTWNRVKSGKILLALHADGENMEDARRAWGFASDYGWQTEYIQSKELDAVGLFRWDEDGSGPYQLEATCGNIGWFDYEERALAGFSSGCNVILRAIGGGMLECEKLFLVSPRIPMLDKGIQKLYKNLMYAGTKVAVFCGQDDEECAPYARRLAEGCKEAGVQADYVELEELAHEFPKDFQSLAGPYLR